MWQAGPAVQSEWELCIQFASCLHHQISVHAELAGIDPPSTEPVSCRQVCDLLLFLHHDLKGQLALDQRFTIIETMNQTDKQIQRLQVVPGDGSRSPPCSRRAPSIPFEKEPPSILQPGPAASDAESPSVGGGRLQGSVSSSADGGPRHAAGGSGGSSGREEDHSLLLGMRRVECDEVVLAQIFRGIRSKAECVGRSLQKGFVTRSSWLASSEGSLSRIDMWGKQVNWKLCEEIKTSPVSLRYLLAERTIMGMI